jgi:hypothetical protein
MTGTEAAFWIGLRVERRAEVVSRDAKDTTVLGPREIPSWDFPPDGFRARNVTLRRLIECAYVDLALSSHLCPPAIFVEARLEASGPTCVPIYPNSTAARPSTKRKLWRRLSPRKPSQSSDQLRKPDKDLGSTRLTNVGPPCGTAFRSASDSISQKGNQRAAQL